MTGHESMGYFAARYGFRLVGALIPSLSSQAEASAGDLADLRRQVQDAGVPAIFNETGTPGGLADAIADETGARVVEIGTHTLPPDGSYVTMMRDIARAVDDGLTGAAPRAEAGAGLGPLIDPFAETTSCSAPSSRAAWWPACAVVGTFVVLRGLAFIGERWRTGCARHRRGLLLGLPGLGGAFVGAAAMIGGVSLVRRRSRLSGDTAIGLPVRRHAGPGRGDRVAVGLLHRRPDPHPVRRGARHLVGRHRGPGRRDRLVAAVAAVCAARS